MPMATENHLNTEYMAILEMAFSDFCKKKKILHHKESAIDKFTSDNHTEENFQVEINVGTLNIFVAGLQANEDIYMKLRDFVTDSEFESHSTEWNTCVVLSAIASPFSFVITGINHLCNRLSRDEVPFDDIQKFINLFISLNTDEIIAFVQTVVANPYNPKSSQSQKLKESLLSANEIELKYKKHCESFDDDLERVCLSQLGEVLTHEILKKVYKQIKSSLQYQVMQAKIRDNLREKAVVRFKQAIATFFFHKDNQGTEYQHILVRTLLELPSKSTSTNETIASSSSDIPTSSNAASLSHQNNPSSSHMASSPGRNYLRTLFSERERMETMPIEYCQVDEKKKQSTSHLSSLRNG